MCSGFQSATEKGTPLEVTNMESQQSSLKPKLQSNSSVRTKY